MRRLLMWFAILMSLLTGPGLAIALALTVLPALAFAGTGPGGLIALGVVGTAIAITTVAMAFTANRIRLTPNNKLILRESRDWNNFKARMTTIVTLGGLLARRVPPIVLTSSLARRVPPTDVVEAKHQHQDAPEVKGILDPAPASSSAVTKVTPAANTDFSSPEELLTAGKILFVESKDNKEVRSKFKQAEKILTAIKPLSDEQQLLLNEIKQWIFIYELAIGLEVSTPFTQAKELLNQASVYLQQTDPSTKQGQLNLELAKTCIDKAGQKDTYAKQVIGGAFAKANSKADYADVMIAIQNFNQPTTAEGLLDKGKALFAESDDRNAQRMFAKANEVLAAVKTVAVGQDLLREELKQRIIIFNCATGYQVTKTSSSSQAYQLLLLAEDYLKEGDSHTAEGQLNIELAKTCIAKAVQKDSRLTQVVSEALIKAAEKGDYAEVIKAIQAVEDPTSPSKTAKPRKPRVRFADAEKLGSDEKMDRKAQQRKGPLPSALKITRVTAPTSSSELSSATSPKDLQTALAAAAVNKQPRVAASPGDGASASRHDKRGSHKGGF